MTLPRWACARPSVNPSLEAVQREHELGRALEAARLLQSRLELLGDHVDDVLWVRQLRDRLVGEWPSLPDLLERADGQ